MIFLCPPLYNLYGMITPIYLGSWGFHRRKLAMRTFDAWKAETRRVVMIKGKKAVDVKLHAMTKEIVGKSLTPLAWLRPFLSRSMFLCFLFRRRRVGYSKLFVFSCPRKSPSLAPLH